MPSSIRGMRNITDPPPPPPPPHRTTRHHPLHLPPSPTLLAPTLQVARNAIWREVLKKEENVAPADNEFRMDPNKLMALTQTPQSMDPTKLLANVDNHEVKRKSGVCVCAVSPRNVLTWAAG